MLFIILGLLLMLLIFAPQMWVRHVMRKHHKPVPGMPGTGGELAKHLIERFELDGILVEKTDEGRDHFDPAAKAVRLSPSNYDGKSLTAVAVSAHEVGHAMQFYRKERIFELRKKYLPLAASMTKAGVLLMMAIPVALILLRSPALVGVMIGASIILQLLGAFAYLIILPEEWDASFNKALPVLIKGEYINKAQVPHVRQVLKAAALTYFAGALANVVNIGRWLMILRR